MKKQKGLFLKKTALLIILAVIAQLLLKAVPAYALGQFKLNQLCADGLLCLVLIIGSANAGLASSFLAAAISPVIVAFFGIMPGGLPQMVAVSAAGNCAVVFVTWLCFRASFGLGKRGALFLNIIGVAAAAALRAFSMWAVTEKFVTPVFKVSKTLSQKLIAAVTVPQAAATLLGGAAALVILYFLKGRVKRRK